MKIVINSTNTTVVIPAHAGIQENGLPEGWESMPLKEAVYIILGQSPSSATYNKEGEGLPFFQGKTEFGELYPTVRQWCTEPKKVAIKDDVLVSVRAPVGPTNLAPSECAIGRGLAALRPLNGADPKYFLYLIRRYEDKLASLGTGTTFEAISGDTLKNFIVPIAPPNQQKLIVAKIEELFSHIDSGIDALKKAKQLLKQYRQSVLKAAVTGELTRVWREANKDKLEPASKLLERILKERRQKWEEQQLKQFKANGKIPKSDKWKEKYKEAIIPNNSDFSEISSYELPQEWCLMTADQLTYFLTDGEHATPPRTNDGIPLLSARNVQNGWLSYEKIDHVSVETHEKLCERLKVEHGDILLSCSGTVGRSCVVPENSNFSLVRSVAVLRSVLDNGVFISLCFRSGFLLTQIERKKTQTAQANIFQGKIKTLLFPVPPISEQEEIVHQVDEMLESINRLESEIDIQTLKAENNKQSILASAFSGGMSNG